LNFSTDDTIVAIATPPGRGGIGVVRLSGPDAARIAYALTGRSEPFVPRHATFARIVDESAIGAAIDHTIVTWFAAPHSYTGDDVIEISGHGSPVVLQRIVACAVGAGARLAEPGEFTLRAYLNGRLDLAQAEAVADLVDAVTPLQARAALDQLEGTLTTAIARVDAALFDLAARLEASLDFPEEGFHFVTPDVAADELSRVASDLAALAREGRAGRVVREGRLVVIAGRPNAGKSSLFNALAGADRAIVTAFPGTTRDMLTERVDIGGLAITLVDTAGLRESPDAIEVEGILRARQAQQVAALTIVVIDHSAPLADEDLEIVRGAGLTAVVVAAKGDLPPAWDLDAVQRGVVEVSALTGEGVDALRRRIVSVLTDREELRDAPAISNLRHVALVERAHDALMHAIGLLAEGATEELVLTDINAARRSLEEITGTRTADDLLHHIFGKFCVGK